MSEVNVRGPRQPIGRRHGNLGRNNHFTTSLDNGGSGLEVPAIAPKYHLHVPRPGRHKWPGLSVPDNAMGESTALPELDSHAAFEHYVESLKASWQRTLDDFRRQAETKDEPSPAE